MGFLSSRSVTIEQVFVVSLSGFSISLFFSQSGIDIFGLASLFALLVWRFVIGYKPVKQLPKSLIIITVVFLLNLFVSAVFSYDRKEGFRELEKYWNIFLCGLLFTCPISGKRREKIITAFLLGASVAGLMGIFQYYGIIATMEKRAHGFTHPIHFAANLAFACGSAFMLLLTRNNSYVKSKQGRYLIMVSIMTTLGGILFSQSRGVWIAFLVACIVVLFLYNRRMAGVFVFSIILILSVTFSLSGTLRLRASSIVTSVYSETEIGSTGNRIELWKGALMIFKKYPLLGTGVGSFETSLNKLISEGKIKEIPVKGHAHNIFLQTLSTQGIIGLGILLTLFVVLLQWGVKEIKGYGSIGGYIIILSTLLTIIGGLTENNIEISKFFAAYCLTLGLLGGYRFHEDKDYGSL